jgi:hypothetical protein
MLEDSVTIVPRTETMENSLAGVIRRMERAGVVFYLNGNTTLAYDGSNTQQFKDHLHSTIAGHGGPLIVVINGFTLPAKYNKSANIRIGIGPSNNYDSGCYIRTNHGVMNFLFEVINSIEYHQV